MKNLFTLTFFERTLAPLTKSVGFLCAAALLCGLYLALWVSPEDYQQGNIVRIMYVHVPAAWLSLLIYGMMTLFAFMGLWMRLPLAFLFLEAAAPIGCVFAGITLVTGSLWGKPMWGAYWVWDGRLTSVLILFITYMGIIALLKSFDYKEKGQRITAFFTLFGALNLPIIKGSVVWWNTLHQPPSVTKLGMPSIHTTMLTPLLIMTLAFISLAFVLGVWRCQTLLMAQKIERLKTRSLS